MRRKRWHINSYLAIWKFSSPHTKNNERPTQTPGISGSRETRAIHWQAANTTPKTLLIIANNISRISSSRSSCAAFSSLRQFLHVFGAIFATIWILFKVIFFLSAYEMFLCYVTRVQRRSRK